MIWTAQNLDLTKNTQYRFPNRSRVRLAPAQKVSLFYYLVYFCYYSWSHCTFWYYSWIPLYYLNKFLLLSTVLSVKNFQFQQNKQFSNTLLFYFTILKNYFNNYIILFYNTTDIPTFIFLFNSLK